MNRHHRSNVAAMCVVVAAMLATAAADVQRVDRSKPPAVDDSAGRFRLRRLSGPVDIDGRAWIVVNPMVSAGTARAASGQFSLTLDQPNEDGDVVRYRLRFVESERAPVTLAAAAGYAFITADSRWIVVDPIDVIDVVTWRRYSLSRVFDIQPYAIVHAVSADGRRLVIRRRDCPFDCQQLPTEYYELELPVQ